MSNQAKKITPALPRGMRDYLPDQMAVRQKIIETLRRVFELYGFQPLETPAMERLEVLSGKYGEEGEKLSFRVMKRGAELERALEKVKAGEAPVSELCDMGLRYDLTVPLARVVAMYRDKLPLPFKRYQIGPVWRADRPQHGRYREFTQCDVDIVGTEELSYHTKFMDAEILCLVMDVFSALNIEIDIRISSRKLLEEICEISGISNDKFDDFCQALDKYDKEGMKSVVEDLKLRGINLSTQWISFLRELSELNTSKIILSIDQIKNKIVNNSKGEFQDSIGCFDLKELFETIFSLRPSMASKFLLFDPMLARGLDYYTGTIFEITTKDKNLRKSLGSIGGGGRYDGLVEKFIDKSFPAIGISFGIDRIIDILLIEGKEIEMATGGAIAIISQSQDSPHTPSPQSISQAGYVQDLLHLKGISAYISPYYGYRLGKQIETAVRMKARFVLIIEDGVSIDKEDVSFGIKRLSTGEQRRLTLDEAVKWIKETEQ